MIRASLLMLTLTTACSFSPPSATPAIQAATLTMGVFEQAQSAHERLVRRSHPPQATLDAYLAAAAAQRKAYQEAHSALMAAIGSIGMLSPEQLEQVTTSVVGVIKEIQAR